MPTVVERTLTQLAFDNEGNLTTLDGRAVNAKPVGEPLVLETVVGVVVAKVPNRYLKNHYIIAKMIEDQLLPRGADAFVEGGSVFSKRCSIGHYAVQPYKILK